MQFDKRKSGIPLIGDLPWGSHFCQFYQTKEDLLDILVPYFRAGLENNEFCLWVTPETLEIGDARKALKKSAPHFERYEKKGQIEIVPYGKWRVRGGKSCRAVVPRLDKAVAGGFDGLRLACSVSPEKGGDKAFTGPGADDISRYNVIAVFAYPRDKFDAIGLMEVVKSHRFALVRNTGRWEIIESSEARIVKDALKRSEEKLQSLFSNMSEGFAYHRIVLDAGGKPCDYVFLEINNAFEKLTGLKKKNIIGKRVTEALPGIETDPTDWIGKYGKVALTGKPIHFESYAGPLDKWFSVSAFSPHKGYFAVTFSDITERKRSEEEIRKLNEELKSNVIQLEAANKELEAFCYSVSHDLRSPLRSISGFGRVLLEDYADRLDAEGRDALERMIAASGRMGQLINDLLNLSRVSRSAMNSGPVNLSEIALEIVAGLTIRQPGRKIEFLIAEGVIAQGDGSLLRILIENLMENAWKFTGRNAEARIEFGAIAKGTVPGIGHMGLIRPVSQVPSTEGEGKTIYFVSDNGAGFDMAYASKLCTPFHRLHPVNEFPGTGVGLATVQRIILRHGGRFWMEGETGKGATAYFTLG